MKFLPMLITALCCSPYLKVSAHATFPSTSSKQSIHHEDETQKANALFDQMYMERVNRNPTKQTSMGLKTNYDKWNDISEEFVLKEFQHAKNNLLRLKALNTNRLDKQTMLSYELFKQEQQQRINDYKWRHHDYPVNQMWGTHTRIPAFLINRHNIHNIADANDYIARISGAEMLIEQLLVQLKTRETKGIIAPKFVFSHVIKSAENIIKGAPFEQGENSTILADFVGKLDKIEITDQEKTRLIKQAKQALLAHVFPTYRGFISYIKTLEGKADNTAGVWKLPNGKAFYNYALQRTTTTNLTADEIHRIGLSEVARIHDEMRTIMKEVGFNGDLKSFFDFMRNDPQFYFPNNEEGRRQYLNEVQGLIGTMQSRLGEVFTVQPKAELEIKPVETFRAASASKAFYQGPSPDGSRPGYYYANLYDMNAMPNYQMAALAYHEAVPGHHMQIGLQIELEEMPMFRKYGGYTAYTEGWALYSELLPKEMGMYENPYSDFGRLAMELWRACRLVVDTGIHAKKWTREQSIIYYLSNTPNPKSDVIKMVERHIVDPSQATAYKIGMMKIIELRKLAKETLGHKFDIREFHNVLLSNGPVPLNVLENNVHTYIATVKNKV